MKPTFLTSFKETQLKYVDINIQLKINTFN